MFYENSIIIYPFVLMNMQLFNNKQGIYCLIHKDEIIYIGQSHRLGKRLAEHGHKSALKKVIQTIIREEGKVNRYKQLALYSFIEENRKELSFAILKETEELDKYEQYYIDKYKPKFNYKGINTPFC